MKEVFTMQKELKEIIEKIKEVNEKRKENNDVFISEDETNEEIQNILEDYFSEELQNGINIDSFEFLEEKFWHGAGAINDAEGGYYDYINLVNTAIRIYNISLSDFAKKFKIKKTTLDTWRNGNISQMGTVLLETLIENYELKQKDEAVKHLFSLYHLQEYKE